MSTIFASMMLASFGAACSPSEPAAENVSWKIQRTSDQKAYQVTASADIVRGFGGFYFPTITLMDDRGCHTQIALKTFDDFSAGDKQTVKADFSETVGLPRPVATAQLDIQYNQLPDGSFNPSDVIRTNLFSDSKVVDAAVRPPELPGNACGKSDKQIATERRERQRARAATDPDGADTEAISDMSRNEVVATAINSAGFLCAKVTNLNLSGQDMIVSCVEYRNGTGRARYRVNAAAGTVEQM